MIKFDPTKLTVDVVQLKSVTTSLGGSISVLDPKRTTPTKEVTTRIVVPMAVARSFIQRTKKVTKYLKPVFTAIVKYDGYIVAMERHPLGAMGKLEDEGLFGIRRWKPDCETNIEQFIKPLTGRGDRQWYFDGRYIYSFESPTTEDAIRGGQFLSADGRFRKVMATSIDLQELSNKDKIQPTDRSCMAFVSARGVYAVSPPIWKNLSDVGGTQIRRSGKAEKSEDTLDNGVDRGLNDEPVMVGVAPDDDEDDEDVVQFDGDENRPRLDEPGTFDMIDESLAVNLNFALKAGQEIGKKFGYEFVEPLQLPRLMIELHTVNLPNVPAEVKATYDIGLKFTHAMAWLLGMSRKTKDDDLETYIMMRSLMKYLTKKGIFRSNVFNADRVFKDGQTVKDVPQLAMDQLMKDQDFTKMSLSAILQQAREGQKRRKKGNDIHNVGGMMTED